MDHEVLGNKGRLDKPHFNDKFLVESWSD